MTRGVNTLGETCNIQKNKTPIFLVVNKARKAFQATNAILLKPHRLSMKIASTFTTLQSPMTHDTRPKPEDTCHKSNKNTNTLSSKVGLGLVAEGTNTAT